MIYDMVINYYVIPINRYSGAKREDKSKFSHERSASEAMCCSPQAEAHLYSTNDGLLVNLSFIFMARRYYRLAQVHE